MGWLSDPIIALEALADSPQLHARPTVLAAPVLRVCIGQLPESVGPQHGTAECKSFHEEVQVACLDACMPHISALIPVGGQHAVGTKGCAVDLQFDDTDAARLKRHALCDEGCIALHTSHGNVHVPVRSQPGRVPSSCAQVRVHNLPAEFRRQGLIAALLACAGYGDSALVQAEFGGELPAAIAACHPQIVRGDVAVGVIKPPQGDARLKNMPRSFIDRGNGLRIGISVETQGEHRPARAADMSIDYSSVHTDHRDTSMHASDASPSEAPSRQQRRRRKARQRQKDARREVPFVRAEVLPAPDQGMQGEGSRRALSQPLDAVRDLGGQMGRRGIGHALQRSAHQVIARQPPAPEAMDCPAADLPHNEPLVEACMLWLEDRVHEVDHAGMRDVVTAFREQNPASWQAHRHSRTLPSRAFRNALRDQVRRQHFGCGIDADSEEEASSFDAATCDTHVPAPVVQDDVQANSGAKYCPPHMRRTLAADSSIPVPKRTLPLRSNRGVPASSPYWAGTAAQSAAPRGSRK